MCLAEEFARVLSRRVCSCVERESLLVCRAKVLLVYRVEEFARVSSVRVVFVSSVSVARVSSGRV